jgi:hypothetical protein
MTNNKLEEISDLGKKQLGMWCDFCGKHHPGMCEKFDEFYFPDEERLDRDLLA